MPRAPQLASHKRRYPRLRDLHPEVTVQRRAAGTKGEATNTPAASFEASIVDLSPEGACLQLDPGMRIRRRDWLMVEIKVDDAKVNLPARVVWVDERDSGPVVGVNLRLEAAPVLVRTRYARWIVANIRARL